MSEDRTPSDESSPPESEGTGKGRRSIESRLSEVESRRRRVAVYSTLPLLAVLAGSALILVLVARDLKQKLGERDQLNAQIASGRAEVEELKRQKAELEAAKAEAALTVNKIKNDARDVEQTGEGAKALAGRILNTIESNPDVTEATPFVYIQIHDESQRRQEGRAASNALRKAGFVVKGIGLVPSVSVPTTEVRYFRPEDEGPAGKAVSALNDAKLPNVGAKLSSFGNPEPGQIEVWFAPAPTPTPEPEPAATLTPVQSGVRRAVSAASGRPESEITPATTLGELGFVSMLGMALLRQNLIITFYTTPAVLGTIRTMPLTPNTRVGDIERQLSR